MNKKLLCILMIATLILPTCGKRITKPLVEIKDPQTNFFKTVLQPYKLASIAKTLSLIAMGILGVTLKYEQPEPCIVAVPQFAITKPQLVAIRSKHRGRLLPQFEKTVINWWQYYRQIFNEQETIEIFENQIHRRPLPAAYQQRIQQYRQQQQ